MQKKFIKILAIALILMAFQCEKEQDSSYVFSRYSVSITPKPIFYLNDTIWIAGKVTSKVFDTAINDSVFLAFTDPDFLSVFKFFPPVNHSNCKDAIDRFELVTEIGNLSFLPRCINGQIIIHPELAADSLFFNYKIGLIPLFAGDYVFSWHYTFISNKNRNFEILENYQIPRHANQLGFNMCGSISWRHLNESDSDFLFTVK